MTVEYAVILEGQYIESSTTKEYTSEEVTTIIDKVTVVNVTSNEVSLWVYLPKEGGSFDPASMVIDGRVLAGYETYDCPELIGQILAPGGMIYLEASDASSLVTRMSGRLIYDD